MSRRESMMDLVRDFIEHHWVDLDADGKNIENVGELSAADGTFDNSVTWPDGTTTQTSPSGGGGGGQRETHTTGLLYLDSNDNPVGKNLETTSTFSGSDTGAVLEDLVDDIAANSPQFRSGNRVIGRIAVDRGVYTFQSTAELTYAGISLVGVSDFEWGKDGPTLFTAGSNLSDQTAMIELGRETIDGNVEKANACRIANIIMNLNGNDVYGLHIYDTDRHVVKNMVIEEVGSGGEGLRVSGSYQSTFEHCQIRQAHFRINDQGKNPNNTIISQCLFQHNANSVPAFRYAGNGNEVFGCRFNQGDANPADPGVSCLASSPSGPTKNWNFWNCKIFGDDSGGVMIEGSDLKFVGCQILGGADDVFSSLRSTHLQSNVISHRYPLITLDGSNNQLEKAVIVGNYIACANKDGQTAAIVTDTGNGDNDHFLISGNVFDGGGDYSIDFASNGAREGFVTGNYMNNPVNESWGGNNFNVRITDNHGYNPIELSRSTPSLPGSTGSTVGNYWGQPATVYHSGGSGLVLVDRNDNTHSLGVDVGTVQVPPFWGIQFTSSVPSSWTWFWE